MNENNTHDDDTEQIEIRNTRPERVEGMGDDTRRRIRQQIQRTNVESQKVENIVNALIGRTSQEHDLYGSDKTPGAPMDPRDELTFTFSPDHLKHHLAEIQHAISFIVTAISQYTGFSEAKAYKTENEHGEDIVKLEVWTTNF